MHSGTSRYLSSSSSPSMLFVSIFRFRFDNVLNHTLYEGRRPGPVGNAGSGLGRRYTGKDDDAKPPVPGGSLLLRTRPDEQRTDLVADGTRSSPMLIPGAVHRCDDGTDGGKSGTPDPTPERQCKGVHAYLSKSCCCRGGNLLVELCRIGASVIGSPPGGGVPACLLPTYRWGPNCLTVSWFGHRVGVLFV